MAPEQPSAGVISRVTVTVSDGAAELGSGFNCVTVSPQMLTEYQNHSFGLPIVFVAISFQPLAVFV